MQEPKTARYVTLRNDSGELSKLLQPYLTNRYFKSDPFDPYSTEKKESLVDRGEVQRHENLKLQKDDLRFTRRTSARLVNHDHDPLPSGAAAPARAAPGGLLS